MLRQTYDPVLVFASIVVASLASFVALDLSGRVAAARGRTRAVWLLASAGAMGIGIWSMHFIGMLALDLGVVVAYAVPLLVLSVLVAIAASAVTFLVASNEAARWPRFAIASLGMGPAIAGMHYIGMAAMHLPARIHYDPRLVAASVLIAITAAFVALVLANYFRRSPSRHSWVAKFGVSVVMGAAIYGMHYTGMIAATFHPSSSTVRPEDVVASHELAWALAIAAVAVLAAAIVAGYANRRVVEARDIQRAWSRARASEAELDKTATFLRTVLDASPLAVISVDLESYVTRWNHAAERIFGWSADQKVGGSILDAIPDDSRDDYQQRLDAALRYQHAEMEMTWRRSDGSPVEVGVSIGRLDDLEGHAAGFVLNVADIGARKMLERRFVEAQKMNAVGQLAGGLAHDFNNLLGVITTYSDLVLDTMPDSDARRNDIAEIRRAADRAAALSRQLLMFARARVVRPEVLDVNEVACEMETMLRRVMPANIAIEFNLAENAGAIEADRRQIEQVLLNLALNSRDAMPNGGALTIETAGVHYEQEGPPDADGNVLPAGSYVVLTVHDTGTGMDPATQRRIFEPFFTTKDPTRGTGLGLSTVRDVIRALNGGISVYSAPGHGTTFKLFIPRTAALREVEAEACRDGECRGTETILVVEDNDVLRRVTARILERDGYTVYAAGSCAEARRLAPANGKVDLLLTDVILPDGNGRDLAREMLLVRPGLRVVFMSGYAGEAVLSERWHGDEGGFLEKPFSAPALERAVRRTLDTGTMWRTGEHAV